MIIKSSNAPIELVFTDEVSKIPVIRVTLWFGETKLKEWTKETLELDGNVAIARFTQAETKQYPTGNADLEVKWLDEDGITKFAEKIKIYIDFRKDLEEMEA